MLITVPWIGSDWATDTVYIIIGVSIAILMIGTYHCIILKICVLMDDPDLKKSFLGGNVICLDFWGRKSGPYIQALHFCLSLGLLTGPLLVDPLSQTHVPTIVQNALPFSLSHPGSLHIIEKREIKADDPNPPNPTLDPLLANIFNTVSSTITPEIVKPAKKPKPAFNDGQKLVSVRIVTFI
jgi:hypothetical protein